MTASVQPSVALIANEFAAVEVRVDTNANGPRLHITDIEAGHEVYLDALDLASLCLAGPRQRESWLRSSAYHPSVHALEVVKGHGSCNDVVVVAGSPSDHFPASEIRHAVRKLCHQEDGLDSRGVYFVSDRDDGTAEAWFFNRDGTTAELCANGLRVVGRMLLDRHQAEQVTVRSGPYSVDVRDAGLTPHGVRQVRVDLPPVDLIPAEPIVADVSWPYVCRHHPAFHPCREVSALTAPNPHLISLVDTYDEAELVATGTRVARDRQAFPLGANVSFAKSLGSGEMFVSTFGRGIGLTPSCGSAVAACRALVSHLRLSDPGRPLLIRNPGGPARTWLRGHGGRWRPIVEGNATLAYAVEIDPATLLGDGPVHVADVRDMQEGSAFSALYDENLKVLRTAGIELEPEGV